MNSKIVLYISFIFLLNPATTVMFMNWLGVEAMALSPHQIECKFLLFVSRHLGMNMFSSL